MAVHGDQDGSPNRRDVIAGVGGLFAAGIVLTPLAAEATPEAVADVVKKLTGGKEVKAGKVILSVPQIAENGNTVPLKVNVDSLMSGSDFVRAVHIYADGNPAPDVATFNFSPMSAKVEVQTRMRMAKTQNVIAIAQMSDGTFFSSQAEVKVTIGGCGG